MNEVSAANYTELLEKALIGGDLSQLSPEQKLAHYKSVCESVGLNPLTRPFEYITLNGKLTLYAKRDATDQLRKIHNVSVKIVSRHNVDGICIVTAQASLPSGRYDESIGAVNITGLRGDALANASMKAETKAKRRVTISICGMGFLDESEVETIAHPIQHTPPPVLAQSIKVHVPPPVAKSNDDEYRVPFGSHKGKTFTEIHPADLADSVHLAQEYLKSEKANPEITDSVLEFIRRAKAELSSLEPKN